MVEVSHIAAYVARRYEKQFATAIDEIKLQKLLYFIQREHIIRFGTPMFDEQFRAWKYGPVLLSVHDKFKKGELCDVAVHDDDFTAQKEMLDYIFSEYAGKTTMSLVGHSHCELSWIRARKGYGKYDKSDVPMQLQDIYDDALLAMKRRAELPARRKMYGFITQQIPSTI